MMHHPNMHHQPMSGHPPQHMGGHQGMPGHHQMPPHQMHRENRHVTLTRVAMGPSQPGAGMAGHGQAMGGMGAMGVPHHGPGQRPPHPIRPMPHHPQAQHHSVPPQMKPMRRPYNMGGAYGPGAPGVMPPPYAQPQRQPQPPAVQPSHTGMSRSSSPILAAQKKLMSDFVSTQSSTAPSAASVAEAADSAKAAPAPAADKPGDERAAPGDSEASRPAPPANSKEKTPMCLVNELARYNKIKHQYRLTSETGPAHKKVFTVTLRLGDTEEYTAEGSSIKRAQHAAASAALTATSFPPPPPRAPAAHASAHPHHRHSGAVMPTVELNALAMKLCQPAVYTSIPPVCAGVRAARPRPPPPYRFPLAPVAVGAPVGVAGVGVGGPLLYRVRVSVGGRAWLGEGATPQAARHDAAARALHDLRPSPGSQVAAATATPGAAATTNGTATTATAQTEGENASPLRTCYDAAAHALHDLQPSPGSQVAAATATPGAAATTNGIATTATAQTEGENGESTRQKPALRTRYDAAARALHDLRPSPGSQVAAATATPGAAATTNGTATTTTAQTEGENGDASADILNSEVKSPVSLVHELALKRNLSVQFTVKSERGPPHMRVFVTACTVGDIETEGEGNGKKVSKRRAAERMLDEMRRRWPPALLRPRPPHDKRRHQPAKKKPRNLIKEGGVTACATNGCAGADNPISRLAVARHAVRARSPQYRVLEERGQARRREFLVQCDAPPHSATGLGPNKKAAKRRAAHNVLLAMEMSTNATDVAAVAAANSAEANGAGDAPSVSQGDSKRKEGSMSPAGAVTTGGAAGEVRQPVPGVLLMDYHQRSGQPPQPNGVSETSATGGGSSPGAKDQLMYLAQLLGFTVQFSDFPKRNHGEYLSLVSLSTEPPVMCHGGGPSTAHSHEQCARAALRALALMGLDAPSPAPGMQSVPATGGGPKPSTVNGIAE